MVSTGSLTEGSLEPELAEDTGVVGAGAGLTAFAAAFAPTFLVAPLAGAAWVDTVSGAAAGVAAVFVGAVLVGAGSVTDAFPDAVLAGDALAAAFLPSVFSVAFFTVARPATSLMVLDAAFVLLSTDFSVDAFLLGLSLLFDALMMLFFRVDVGGQNLRRQIGQPDERNAQPAGTMGRFVDHFVGCFFQ